MKRNIDIVDKNLYNSKDAQYDAAAKSLLSQNQILAYI